MADLAHPHTDFDYATADRHGQIGSRLKDRLLIAKKRVAFNQ